MQESNTRVSPVLAMTTFPLTQTKWKTSDLNKLISSREEYTLALPVFISKVPLEVWSLQS